MAELRGRSNNKVYRALEKLGSGGEGAVYSIAGDPTRVMKIYHDPKPELISKITKMVESNLKHSTDVSFPEELIFEGNLFRGFVMKRVKGDSFSSVYATSTKNRAIPQDVKFTIAKNLCIALSNVHEAGFVFGDFNPANIKVDVKRRTVTLMDTDSFIFDRFGGKVARPEMVPMEIRSAMKANESLPDERKKDLPFTKESDVYTLAVHLFRLLMNGEHPFNYKPTRQLSHQPMYAYELDPPTFPYLENKLGIAPPPHGIPLEAVPMDLRMLFVRMFRDGYSDPTVRPSIREFLTEIDLYEKASVQCKVNNVHRFDGVLGTCPFCDADRRHSQALRGISPGTVPVSKAEYVFDMDYDFILDHPEKLPLLKKRAASGSSVSLLVMGRLCSDGILEQQNDRKAAEYFLRSASSKRPSAEAQYRLGLCFLDGIGVPVSKSDAIKWLTRSADQGFSPAKQLLEYAKDLALLSPMAISEPMEDVVHPMEDEAVPDTQVVVKRARRSSQQKCIDDVSEGKRGDSMVRLYRFIMEDKVDWAATPSIHQPFKDAADDAPEYAFLYSEIMDKLHDSYHSDLYLSSSAQRGYVPAMLRIGERCMSLNDLDGARAWYERARSLDSNVCVPEELVVDRRSRIRGGMSMFIDRIKNLWNRNRS